MKLKNYIKKIRISINNIKNIDKIFYNQLVISRYENLATISKNYGITQDVILDLPLIVSLTTYGLRINDVYLTIESLLHQTIKPNKIVLWLDNSFKNESIPIVLKQQIERGLEIQYCNDLRSYTKLIPTLEMYPDSIIISVDDDMIYSTDFIEHLVNGYKKDNSKIYFYRGHKIITDKKGRVKPYIDWVKKGANKSSILNVPTGVCGVLYPKNCFHSDVTKKEIFMDICPYADDIWFKAMSFLKGIECEKIEMGKDINDKFVYVNTALESSLSNVNNVQGMNDVQIKKVFKYYNLNNNLNEVALQDKQ